MPTLHWTGKEKAVQHHRDIPLKMMKHCYGFSVQSGLTKKPVDIGNKIIHGDNLEALKALLPEYEGKIKGIYIDPPYNTGKGLWIYNDNPNRSHINQWLKELEKEEKTRLSRHDKWLCMMYPRLVLLHQLLASDGIIFVSIDDHELAHLKLLMDEIFGEENFIEYFSWVKTVTPSNLSPKSRKTIEYVLCYEKKRSKRKYKAEEGSGEDAPLLNEGNTFTKLTFPKEKLHFNLGDGHYKKGRYGNVILLKDLTIKNGQALQDLVLKGNFKWKKSTLESEIARGTSFIVKTKKFSIRYLRKDIFKAPSNLIPGKYSSPILERKEMGIDTNEGAQKELKALFGEKVFDYPKPVSLIEFFIKLMDDPEGIILDSFAGSGTTGHAVLNANKRDNGQRKFILIQMEEINKKGEPVNITETITAERIKKVISGYGETKGTGGGFDYYELEEFNKPEK